LGNQNVLRNVLGYQRGNKKP